MINIGGLSSDVHYRYKMPAVKTSSTRNNKTQITNLDKVAKDLERTPEFLLKNLALLFHTSHNIKKQELNGTYTTSQVQDGITTIINKFILCKECENPETYISSDHTIVCKACGHVEK